MCSRSPAVINGDPRRGGKGDAMVAALAKMEESIQLCWWIAPGMDGGGLLLAEPVAPEEGCGGADLRVVSGLWDGVGSLWWVVT